MSGTWYGVCPTCGIRRTAPGFCAWCAGERLSRIPDDGPMTETTRDARGLTAGEIERERDEYIASEVFAEFRSLLSGKRIDDRTIDATVRRAFRNGARSWAKDVRGGAAREAELAAAVAVVEAVKELAQHDAMWVRTQLRDLRPACWYCGLTVSRGITFPDVDDLRDHHPCCAAVALRRALSRYATTATPQPGDEGDDR